MARSPDQGTVSVIVQRKVFCEEVSTVVSLLKVDEDYHVVDAPNRVEGQALHSTSGSIDGVELDTEDQCHLGLKGLDMNAVANGTKNTCSKLDGLCDLGKVGRGEVEDVMVRVRLDNDGDLDLTFELVDLGGIL